ncbi:uncharacterized protein Z518_02938 [Rhinocladiella mackenziei CBS 650.93]|uniref:Uncharacterized protein n=1 Tax=Rhinocladiella mackenziei CBS 650.93 TaxID=1442369 RepID=A0A0D2G158_9EURO|nr:uncharacterized protein Z518_02938 [Rhinocladiella mackenziei CBS 650.93]KIX08282.1 hypothetical protein Z518_02938 [Rhinocladiella mackenziei CBS 650.93]
MDSNQPNAYLNVPVTDAERAQANNQSPRDDSSDRLLPESQLPPPEETAYRNDPVPLRFPSIHAPPVIRNFPPAIAQRLDSRQYAPISPIHEEDEAHSIALREPSERLADDGYLLAPPGPTPPLWTPIWLKQWVLGLFALLFALLLVALVLLWHYDEQNDGFEVAEGTSHYAWAYTPTVIAVLIVAAWRMVDHHSKLAMPFDSLQNGPIKPSESLLVDYISNFQLVSLYEAFKNSHFAVTTTITGFILLKVVTVFSTGLLVLLPTQVAQTGSSVQVQGFTANAFDPNTALDSSTFSALPVYAYYGSMAQGMPLENGVTFDLAYGAMTVNSNSSIGDDTIISGTVDAFVPIMTCQQLDAKLDSPAIVNDTNADSAFATSSNISLTIQAGDVCDQFSSISVPADNPYTEILPERQVLGTMQEIYCGTTNGSVADSKGPVGLLFTITDINYQQTLFDNASDLAGGTFTIASGVSRTLTNMTSVFCTPSYTMTQVKVTNNTQILDSNQAISVTLQKDATNSTLSQFSNWNASNVLVQSSISAETLFGDTINDDTISDSSAIFTLMAMTRGSENIDSLLDSDKMISAAQDTYKGILSQYAHQTLRATNSDDIEDGTVTREERRLRINDVSLWTMASIFGLLVLFCIALIFIAPRAVVPRDPSSIAAIATILTRSTELNRLLRRQGAPSYANQKSALAGFEFGTAIATTESGKTSFKIVTSEGELDEPTPKPNTDIKWWLPITATIPVIVLTLILPLAIIVVLEIVQRSSDDSNGFYTVADDKWTEVYSHYIPGIVMLILATLVNMLDFNVALFGPWINLANGNAISKKSLLNHILGRSPPFAFLQALRTRYVGGILSILAATLASILTVIASGLYTVEHFTVEGPDVSLKQLDSFTLSWPNSFTTDNGAAAMTDLIMHQNFNYPQFTYEGLVFPSLSLDNSALTTDSLTSVSGSSSHVFPGVRGNLRCEVLPASSFNLTTEKAGSDSAYSTDQAFVTATAALPDSCHLGGYTGTDSVVTYENNFELPEGGEGTYAGAQLDLLFGENATLYGNYGEARGQYIGDNPAVGCPSLAFTFGHFKLDNTDKSQVTTMICYQEIQGFQANVTLKLNSTTIDPDHPPVVDEGSISLEENPASNIGAKSFDFRIQNNLAQEMTLFNGGSGTPASDPSSTNTFDIYFQAIINGTEKHDPTSLAGENNQDVLVDAINKFYRIYMAQAISVNMRAPLDSSTPSRLSRRQDSTASTSTTITTPRLVQDNASKLTLQILLGIMTALSAAAWLTTKMRRVLPCNPCSLAGAMSLLAGSDLCHSADDGLCECCGKPRRRSFGFEDGNRPVSIHAGPDEDDDDEREQIIPDGAEWMPQSQFETLFGGKRYSMGWWRERKSIGKRRRFGVDVGARADGADDQDWELGERRPEGQGFSDFMMRGGDRDGRGEYSRFGAPSPDPAAMDAGFPQDPPGPSVTRPPMASGMGIGIGGGEPGPATLARRQTGSLTGGEA